MLPGRLIRFSVQHLQAARLTFVTIKRESLSLVSTGDCCGGVGVVVFPLEYAKPPAIVIGRAILGGVVRTHKMQSAAIRLLLFGLNENSSLINPARHYRAPYILLRTPYRWCSGGLDTNRLIIFATKSTHLSEWTLESDPLTVIVVALSRTYGIIETWE